MNPQNKHPRITVICPCGKSFETTSQRIDGGRGKYCSKQCQYKFAIRPKIGKGVYKLKKENNGWFKQGHANWNTGLHYKIDESKIKKGIHYSPDTEFKKGERINEQNNNWKGDSVGYLALHTWITRKLGKADVCQKCSSTKTVEWANISREYKRDFNDWIKLCKKCHGAFDSGENWGKATIKFNLKSKRYGDLRNGK